MELKIRLERSPRNPILSPTDNWWESRGISNPGVLKLGGRIHLIYTAKGEDSLARMGYARLKEIDQVEDRLSYPIFTPDEWFELDGVEDPRLVVLDGRVFMLYAGKEKDMARPCEASISIEDLLNNKWAWSRHRLLLPVMTGIHNRNATFFPRKINGRFVLLHRPVTVEENIWISFSYDRVHWYDHKEILRPRGDLWDNAKIGAAGPPIELEEGWLFIYHGVEAQTWTYRLGCALLDREHPEVVLWRCDEPILEPEEEFEKEGITPNVVFSCGAVILEDELVLYYGAADKYVCVARGKLPLKPVNSEGEVAG